MTYIDANNILLMMAIVTILTWVGFIVDSFRIGQTVPGVVWILVGGLRLSYLRVIFASSPVGGFIAQYVVAAAIPLLMIKSNLTG